MKELFKVNTESEQITISARNNGATRELINPMSFKKERRLIEGMWVSKKNWNALEKRIADLEVKTQSQQNAMLFHLESHGKENEELKAILENIREMLKLV